MFYEGLEVSDCKYQCTSHYRLLSRSDGQPFSATESAYCELKSRSGRVAFTAVLSKTPDNLSFRLMVPDTATENILGPYLILVFLEDSTDSNIHDELAKYEIEYTKKEAV